MTLAAPGRCRHCGCTDELPCRLHHHARDEFAWTSTARNLCNGRECQRAEADRKAAARAAAKAERPKSRFAELAALHPGWERGAILGEKRRQEQRARRRGKGKGRAA